MSDTKVARLDGVLTELVAAASGIEAAAVVSFDGLMMASTLPDGLDEDRVAAMSAALLSLGEQAIEGFGCGHLDQLFAEGDDGFVVMMAAGDEAVLTAVAQREAKLGFVLYEMRRAAADVVDVLTRRTTDVGDDLIPPPALADAAPAAPPLPTRPVGDAADRTVAFEPHQPVLNGGRTPLFRTTPPAAWS